MRYFNKKRFTMRQVVGLLTIVFLGIAVITYAVSFSDFTSGTPILASEMNSKLNALKDAINKKDTSCQGNSANDVLVKVGPLCVDKYEASVWSNADGTVTQYGTSSDNYPAGFPDTGNWTTQLYAISRAGVTPSRYITWFQAQQACAASGKRLLTNAEWQMAAAGTPDNNNCNVSSVFGVPANTGGNANCVSNYQVNDMVGNLWEWVADWVPASSACPGWGGFSDDYMCLSGASSTLTAPGALLRGGNWADGAGAGVFTVYGVYLPTYSSYSIGFRCVR